MACRTSRPARLVTGIALVALLLTWRAAVLGDWTDWLSAALALACTELALAGMLRRQRRRESGRV